MTRKAGKNKKKAGKNKKNKKQQSEVMVCCPVLAHLDLEFYVLVSTPGLLGRMILSRCASKGGGVTLNTVNICTMDLPPLDQELLEEVDRKVCNITVESIHGIFDNCCEDDDFDEYQFNSDNGYGYGLGYNCFSDSDDDYTNL